MDKPENIAEDQWITTSRGVDSINFQRAAHMTWISVLMAMVVVVLADKTYSILGEVFTRGRWVLLLYVVASGLLVVQAWIQYTWLILITHSPIQPVRTGLSLLNGIAIYVICLSIEEPARWFIALSFFLLVSLTGLLVALRLHVLTDLLAKNIYYLIAALGVDLCITISASWHLSVNNSTPVVWFWGILCLGSQVFYLWLISRWMAEGRRYRNIP